MRGAEGGRIVTFYSSTGGTGRSMTLANIAWILASNGLRVLTVDWDLESPGLYRYFHPFVPGAADATQGMVDLLNDYLRAAVTTKSRSGAWHAEYARVLRHAFSLTWDEFPDRGSLDYLSAGHTSTQYAPTYWEHFYQRRDLPNFIEALRTDMRRNYDYVLIDSQTGLNDTASICADVIPDVVVACFVLSGHSIEMTADFARAVGDQAKGKRRQIRILPVPMKIDFSDTSRVAAGLLTARAAFAGFPNGLDDTSQAAYWETAGIPYWASAAFEENLAVFEDRRDPPALLNAYERLAFAVTEGQVTAMPPMDELTRLKFCDEFTRKPPQAAAEGASSS
jgi:Mrp family chromosome partitioning ATPase